MKKFIVFIVFSFSLFSISTNAQESFRVKFTEANKLMEENQYNIALPIWLDLKEKQPDNFNVNYKIGICYINSANHKQKSLTYLIIAVKSTSSNYDPFSTSEKKSPREAYFYLARAYHLTYNLETAITNYNTFKEKVSKKHYLYNEVEHHIQQCENAIEAVKNPANVKVNNLGITINSEFADYSPVISLDESSIYFTSRRIRKDSSNYYIKDINDGQHYEDVYVSHNYDGVWAEPELISVNTEGHEATLNISVDGQTLFIFKDDNGDGNIYESKLEEDEWSFPVKLGSDINLKSRETHAHITPDEKMLFFVSDREGGKGGQDIYFCKKLPNGEWAKAQNLGDSINTKYDEAGIFIHPDGKTIYFSSKGHKSIGGYDIFSSEMDKEENWSTPVNMGYPINSTDDDVFFVTSADGKRGYYSSFQDKGYGEKDIYVISLEDVDAKPVTLLTGFMKIEGDSALSDNAQVTVTDNVTEELVGIYKPRQKDGKFSVILTPGNEYHITYSAADYIQEEDLYIPPFSAYQEIKRGINLKDVTFGMPIDTTIKEPKFNYQEGDRVKKLKAEIHQLLEIIENDEGNKPTPAKKWKKLKTDLNNINRVLVSDTSSPKKEDKKIDDLEKAVKKVKAKITQLLSEGSTKPTVVTDKDYYYKFRYGERRVNPNNKKYIDLIKRATEKIKKDGVVVIEIESSASKVPTRKAKESNAIIAHKRGVNTQEMFINSLVQKGIDKENIITNKIFSGINGPDYKGDYIENKATYEKYQYVIIKIIK